MGKGKGKKNMPKFMSVERERQVRNQEQKAKDEMRAFSKEYGKDGSYMEIETTEMSSFLLEKSDLPKMLVIKNNRISLNEDKYILALKQAFEEILAEESSSDMKQDQLSFYVFKRVFERGLETFFNQD